MLQLQNRPERQWKMLRVSPRCHFQSNMCLLSQNFVLPPPWMEINKMANRDHVSLFNWEERRWNLAVNLEKVSSWPEKQWFMNGGSLLNKRVSDQWSTRCGQGFRPQDTLLKSFLTNYGAISDCFSPIEFFFSSSVYCGIPFSFTADCLVTLILIISKPSKLRVQNWSDADIWLHLTLTTPKERVQHKNATISLNSNWPKAMYVKLSILIIFAVPDLSL